MLKRLVYSLVFVYILVLTCSVFGQNLQSVDRLAVFDTNGNRVGRVIGNPQDPRPARVYFNLEETLFRVNVLPDRFIGDITVLRFESLDCTGPAYVTEEQIIDAAALKGIWPTQVAVGPTPDVGGTTGNTVLALNLNETLQQILVGSLFSNEINDPRVCNPQSGTPIMVIGTSPISNLDDFFTAPFSIGPDRSSNSKKPRK